MTLNAQDWLSAAGRTHTLHLPGAAGTIEVLVDAPGTALPRGVALVAHPQPLLGGSAHHKVPHLLARTLREMGWLAARPNFRGVGQSGGTHDEGRGECDDLHSVSRALQAAFGGLPLALVGFSFGAFVQSQVAHRLAQEGHAPQAVMLAGMPAGVVAGGRVYDPGPAIPRTLVVHGEHDERVPLASVLDWARPQGQPVVVVPGADHFFTGRLPALRELMQVHLAGSVGSARAT